MQNSWSTFRPLGLGYYMYCINLIHYCILGTYPVLDTCFHYPFIWLCYCLNFRLHSSKMAISMKPSLCCVSLNHAYIYISINWGWIFNILHRFYLKYAIPKYEEKKTAQQKFKFYNTWRCLSWTIAKCRRVNGLTAIVIQSQDISRINKVRYSTPKITWMKPEMSCLLYYLHIWE